VRPNRYRWASARNGWHAWSTAPNHRPGYGPLNRPIGSDPTSGNITAKVSASAASASIQISPKLNLGARLNDDCSRFHSRDKRSLPDITHLFHFEDAPRPLSRSSKGVCDWGHKGRKLMQQASLQAFTGSAHGPGEHASERRAIIDRPLAGPPWLMIAAAPNCFKVSSSPPCRLSSAAIWGAHQISRSHSGLARITNRYLRAGDQRLRRAAVLHRQSVRLEVKPAQRTYSR
jgi:hypothetical protein